MPTTKTGALYLWAFVVLAEAIELVNALSLLLLGFFC